MFVCVSVDARKPGGQCAAARLYEGYGVGRAYPRVLALQVEAVFITFGDSALRDRGQRVGPDRHRARKGASVVVVLILVAIDGAVVAAVERRRSETLCEEIGLGDE
jgi:hypothetical protein